VDTFRTFIAIELPAESRANVIEHIQRLRRELPNVRASWGREDNLHLTLKFLGNVPVADLPNVYNAVEQAAKAVSPFKLTLAECGMFPTRGRPNVLWIGAQASGLFTLQASIEEELSAAGFPPESRPFHPHLTIARLRNAEGVRELGELHRNAEFVPLTMDVSEVVVFRSELRREGSKHTAISRHSLS
jgi:2'-5' RNA ligase